VLLAGDYGLAAERNASESQGRQPATRTAYQRFHYAIHADEVARTMWSCIAVDARPEPAG
jgi:hypothetical protein